MQLNSIVHPGKNRLNLDEENLLIKEAQEGGHSAFEKLYRLNVGKVYAICLRITVDRNKAEELTQDTFVRAWENLDSFRGESLFSTWLYRIAVNVTLIHMRSNRRRFARFSSLSKLIKLSSREEHSSGIGIDIEKAITKLPLNAKMIFIMHDIEGYKHDEIAEMMSIAPGTTKAQLHRARSLLREALEK